jgi:hypothetical protein
VVGTETSTEQTAIRNPNYHPAILPQQESSSMDMPLS